ncbi:MAG: polyphosphate polymerase domain-containing protein [Desulfobacterales bacterium]
MSPSLMPSLLERYELKYLIPESMIDPISDFISAYCSPDYYSEQSADGFYNVYSLYFDSPDFLFLRKRMEGAENRFNMRIRTYDPVSAIPCFFEVKQKTGGIVRKYRATVHDADWQRVFADSDYSLHHCNKREKADLFVRLAYSWQAEPKVLTCYSRKAYVSDVDDYARVTFDKALKCQAEERYNLIPDPYCMNSYDNATVFDPGCSVILELKCYATQVPLWMLDLIRYFDLQRGSFSKYAASIFRVRTRFRYDTADRMPLIPCFA